MVNGMYDNLHTDLRWSESKGSWTVVNLEETIKEDIGYWERLVNKGKMIDQYMCLYECKDSRESGLWQLCLNGMELWYGTLEEINAVVKSMIRPLDKPEDYDLQDILTQ